MKRKGYDFKVAMHLNFREVNPEVDSGLIENPEKRRGYLIPVAASACYRPAKDDEVGENCLVGSKYLDNQVFDRSLLKTAPCVSKKITFSRTNMCYGAWRRNSTGRWFWISDQDAEELGIDISYAEGTDTALVWFDIYYTCPVYWIESGYVFRATRRTWRKPDSMKDKK